MYMKNITLLSRVLASFSLGCCVTACAVAHYPIREAIQKPYLLDKRDIAISGYLCVDGTEIYLASSTICDVIEEEKANEFMIPLVLDPGNVTRARTLDRSYVEVQGIFRAPPHDATILKSGLLLGFFVEGHSIRAAER